MNDSHLYAVGVKPTCLHENLGTFEGITSAFGLILNAILGFLIVYRTEKELDSYRRVLICNCSSLKS